MCKGNYSATLNVPNVTARPSTVSVPVTVLLYSGLLLCGVNVPIKGLTVVGGKADDCCASRTNFEKKSWN